MSRESRKSTTYPLQRLSVEYLIIIQRFGYYRLPSKFDIHEYSIMERFIYDLPIGCTRDELAGCIHGKGAFRRFKDSIRYHGIEQDWYDYRINAYREIAVEWCESNRFAYFEKSAEKTTWQLRWPKLQYSKWKSSSAGSVEPCRGGYFWPQRWPQTHFSFKNLSWDTTIEYRDVG